MSTRGNFLTNNLFRKIAGALALGTLCFASLNALAQVSKTITDDGAVISTTQPKANTVVPSAHPKIEEALPAGSVVVFSNFGTGDNLYGPSGWTEAGLEANDFPIAEAMSFTPAANYALVRIDIAMTYVSGTNGMTLILAQDNSGIPGKPLFKTTFTNLPDFGSCCTIQTVTLNPQTSPIALKSGHTYWLYPMPANTTSYLVWNQDTTNQGGNGAVSRDYGKTWNPAALSPFGAFDIYGMQVGK
jgi:hypothetical protein